jgi:Flp pilus assembly protein TadD
MRPRAPLVTLAVMVGVWLAWWMFVGSQNRSFRATIAHRPPSEGAAGETPAQAGLRLLRENKPSEALPRLRQATRLDPANAVVMNNLCVAEIQVGELGAAIRDCNRAIELAPDFQLARNNLAWARAEHDTRVRSMPTRMAAAESAGSAPTWIAVGMDWYRLGEWDRSLRCFERALRLEPTNATALNDVGAVWMEKHQPDLALGFFRRSLAADPDHALARNNAAWAQAVLDTMRPPRAAAR